MYNPKIFEKVDIETDMHQLLASIDVGFSKMIFYLVAIFLLDRVESQVRPNPISNGSPSVSAAPPPPLSGMRGKRGGGGNGATGSGKSRASIDDLAT
nr:polyol transporter 5-like [Ipomoea batatas]